MERDDPLLLPMCQICGKYKGIGPCKNSRCPGSIGESKIGGLGESRIEIRSCSRCENKAIISCSRCDSGFCKNHGHGATNNHLITLDQVVGTCIICGEVVCENCWILESDGAITCLVHHETHHRRYE
ncbi:MAG: hypothetical protein ACFFCP_13935 [Promethearchaeota archaeon]